MFNTALDAAQRDCTFDFRHKKEPIIMAMLEGQ
jgi:hypothetical protein